MKLTKFLLSFIIMGVCFFMPINTVKAEEEETVLYNLDLAEMEGSSDVYEYSFDGENWSTEHEWMLVQGKEYTVYVKRPDGIIQPFPLYVVAQSESSTTQTEEKESFIDVTENEISTESSTEIEITQAVGIEEVQEAGSGNTVVVIMVLILVVIVGAGIFLVSKNKR